MVKKKDLQPIETNTPWANKVKKKSKYLKLPILKQRYRKREYPDGLENQTASPIPINVSLGTMESEILHYKVTEYFIQKAGAIVLMDCPCRKANGCKNHDIHLGCTWLGKGASAMDLAKFPGARIATKEEALEREHLANKNGLVPHLGKLRGDAKIYKVLEFEHQFMSICHCCSCCCVVSLMKYGPSDYKKVVKRMEGVEVRVDREKCEGCGKCFEVCIYNGLEMKKEKTMINQSNCMGCGRCERVCPNEAISISIDDFGRINELISRFEARVDIT
jgi:UDP-glucose 4-epimerase